MNNKEVMQQALEALIDAANVLSAPMFADAVDALKAALEQPAQQEPVAWGVFDGPSLHNMFFTEEEALEMVRLKGDGSMVKPLSPPAQRILRLEALLERQTARIVDLQTHIDNFDGEDR